MKKRPPPCEKSSALDQRPNFNTPIEPARGTQASRLLFELRSGRAIDPLTAWVRLGIYRLSAIIFELRRAGWSIHMERRPVRNRFGEECRVGFYTLTDGGQDV